MHSLRRVSHMSRAIYQDVYGKARSYPMFDIDDLQKKCGSDFGVHFVRQ